MDNYSQEDEVKFIESLYDNASEQLKEIYKDQKKNRDELLKEIANVMLTYTIVDTVMNLTKDDRNKLSKKFLDLITGYSKSQSAITEKVITEILTDTVDNTFKFYNYNAGLKDVEKIITSNYHGKHFSTRVWNNEREVAKYLYEQTQSFLQGKVNVNQIKKSIEKNYNSNAHEVRRLVETEVNRCEDQAFKIFCKETNVKKLKRNEVMDKDTCKECAELDGKIYSLDDAPGVIHPLCRGFNTIYE